MNWKPRHLNKKQNVPPSPEVLPKRCHFDSLTKRWRTDKYIHTHSHTHSHYETKAPVQYSKTPHCCYSLRPDLSNITQTPHRQQSAKWSLTSRAQASSSCITTKQEHLHSITYHHQSPHSNSVQSQHNRRIPSRLMTVIYHTSHILMASPRSHTPHDLQSSNPII